MCFTNPPWFLLPLTKYLIAFFYFWLPFLFLIAFFYFWLPFLFLIAFFLFFIAAPFFFILLFSTWIIIVTSSAFTHHWKHDWYQWLSTKEHERSLNPNWYQNDCQPKTWEGRALNPDDGSDAVSRYLVWPSSTTENLTDRSEELSRTLTNEFSMFPRQGRLFHLWQTFGQKGNPLLRMTEWQVPRNVSKIWRSYSCTFSKILPKESFW